MNYDQFSPVNMGIIVVTSYISYMAFKKPKYLQKYIFDTRSILIGREYYRILSSACIHADPMHLIFNMFSLYSFGLYIEKIYGALPFLVIYASGILGGNLLSLLIHRNENYRALGASGGVCGVIFASIFLLPGGKIYMFPIPVPIPSHVYAIFFIVASYYGLRKSIGNIGHDAHLGGAIIGLIVTTAMYPAVVSKNKVIYSLVMCLSVALVLYSNIEMIRKYLVGSRGKRASAWGGAKRSTRRKSDEEVLEELLKKISKSGVESLNYFEKRRLEEFSGDIKDESERT